MANYIDRKEASGAGESADIKNIMPYLGEELRVIREKDKEKKLAFSRIQQGLMEDPEGFRNAKYEINGDGTMSMNDKAKEYAAVARDDDQTQDAIDTTEEVYDNAATTFAKDTALIGLNADGQRANASRNATAISDAIKPGEFVTHVSRNESLTGEKLLDGTNKPTLPSSSDVGKQTQDALNAAVGVNTPTTNPTQGLKDGTPIVVDNQPASAVNQVPETAPATSPADKLIDKTAKTGVGANVTSKAKEANSVGASDSRNYSIATDVGVGKSSAEVELAKRITKTKKAGIYDADRSNIQQLRKAAMLEGAMSALNGGTPGAEKMVRLNERLAKREEFLASLGDKKGLSKSTTLEGGKVKYDLGDINAKISGTSGVTTQMNMSNNVDARTNVKTDLGGAKDPNANKVQSETFIVDGVAYESQKLDRNGNKNVNNSGQSGYLPISYDNVDWNTKKSMEKQLKRKGEEYVYFPSSVGSGVKIRYVDGKPKNAVIDPNGYYNSNLEQSFFRTGKATNTKDKASANNVNDPTLTDNKGVWNPQTGKWE